MASWMIHLRVADRLMDRIPGLDETAFVMGNIAPDSGVPNADWTAYSPPKAVSHYKTRREDETFFDIGRFLREHFSSEQIRAYSRREFSFFLGYYAHLLTDADWTLNIFRPMIAEYVEKRGEDKNAFIWKMKRDWYDLDFRYLEEHPDFRAFGIYEQASGFSNEFMDIFSKDALDNRREYICGFYRGQHGELYREYPFLNPAQADSFVEKTVESVFAGLKESLAVRNEGNTLSLKDLQPSQFFISEKKLRDVQSWLNPSDLSNFEAIPVKILDGIPVMTDGHTRAAAAVLAGLESVPLAWERDDLNWEMYRRCVKECRKRKISSPQDLVHCIIPETDYSEKWDRWCDQMQASILRQNMDSALTVRRMTDLDMEPLYMLLSDPKVMRFLEPPYTREQVSAFLRKGLSEKPPVYTVEASGSFAGYVIYHPYDGNSIEIGWVLLPEYWGKGYASGLTKQMIDKAAGEGKTLVIECDPQQEVTKHIARKFGFSWAESSDGLDVYRL